MTPEQVTEYLERVIRPRMSTIEGVAEIQIIGAANYAMRVWIDPLQLAARGVTAADVLAGDQRLELPRRRPARPRTSTSPTTITMQTTLQTPEAFGALPLAATATQVVRLRDVAHGRARRRGAPTTIVTFNGKPGTFIGVFPTPAANPLDTAAAVVDELPAINASLPQGMTIELVYDSTETISASIEEVFKTIAEAVVDRRRGDPAVPRLVPLGADAGRDDPAVADRRLLRAAARSAIRSTCCRCSPWCWPSASSSTTPSSWSRTSTAISRRG